MGRLVKLTVFTNDGEIRLGDAVHTTVVTVKNGKATCDEEIAKVLVRIGLAKVDQEAVEPLESDEVSFFEKKKGSKKEAKEVKDDYYSEN